MRSFVSLSANVRMLVQIRVPKSTQVPRLVYLLLQELVWVQAPALVLRARMRW